jgi:hypothetical protein
MRALLTMLCLFSGSPEEAATDEVQLARLERTDHYRDVLAEIAIDTDISGGLQLHDLPAGVREAIETWTMT